VSLPLETIADRLKQHPKLVIADDFEIAIQRSATNGVRYHNGEMRSQSRGQRLWVSLRILHRKRGGKAVVLNPSIESLAALVDSAFESANRAAVDPWFRFPLWKNASSKSADVAGDPFVYDSLYELCQQGCAALDESYDENFIETHLRRKTERFDLRHRRSEHLASWALLAEPAEEVVFLKEEHARSTPLHDRLPYVRTLIESAARRASQKAKPCGRGKRRLILAPRVMARLLRAVAPWFCADSVQNGRSPLRESMGSSFFAGPLTLIDHGNHEASPWAAPFDLEGSPTQRTVLVEKGQLKSWLFDVYSATRDNRLSSGNFLRPSSEMYPRIAPSTLYIEAGTLSTAELFEQLGTGVYFDTLDSLEPVSGESAVFILRGSGWRVAFGQSAESLSGIEVRVDLRTLFRGASAVAKDLAFFAGYGSPSILVEDVPLGS
jgi:predicted Zn-dependent protease